MMRGYVFMLLLLSASVAEAAPAAATTSAKAAIPSPEEDYRAALKAYADDDLMGAGSLFRRAAERGHAAAQAELAYQLEYATAYKEALEFYQKSAEQGNSAGQMGLGLTYANGRNPEVKQDFVEARKWITLAAEQGYRPAIVALFAAYTEGGFGLDDKERSGPDAAVWIKRAAEIDHVPAITALAAAYRTGLYGIEPDPKQADILDARATKLSGRVEKKTKKARR